MTNNKLFKLPEEERNSCLEKLKGMLEARPEIVFAYAYGSFAGGYPFHDIDIGVYVAEIRKDKATLVAMELAESIRKKLRFPIDVRVVNFAPVSFVYNVFRGRLLVDKDSETRSRITERTVARYLDIKPVLRKATKEAFAE